MSDEKLKVEFRTQFRRDVKRLEKQHKIMIQLFTAIDWISNRDPLPDRFRDHALTGNWINHRECHIGPDWLLIYRIDNEKLILICVRTGSHAELGLK